VGWAHQDAGRVKAGPEAGDAPLIVDLSTDFENRRGRIAAVLVVRIIASVLHGFGVLGGVGGRLLSDGDLAERRDDGAAENAGDDADGELLEGRKLVGESPRSFSQRETLAEEGAARLLVSHCAIP
jgi:hypothetical protein